MSKIAPKEQLIKEGRSEKVNKIKILKKKHRHLSIIDSLSFVMCPLLAPLINSVLFLLWSFTVLMKQTRQAVRVIK